MRSYQILMSSSVLALAIACSNPAADKPKATVTDAVSQPASAASTAVAPAAVEVLSFSAADSKVGFIGAKVTGSHTGNFNTFTGTIDFDSAAPEKSRIKVEIDAASLKTDDAKLDEHLKSPDFFDVAKFPKATFESTEIKVGGDNGATHTITGNLDFHGVKKAVTFPATVTVAADSVTAKSEFQFMRQDFGVVYPGMKDDLIKNEVALTIEIKAARKK
jgi:polyisoprenoid-binding protein YceI